MKRFFKKLINQLEKTFFVFVKPAGLTWIVITILKYKSNFQIDSLHYTFLTLGIIGIKTYKRIKEMLNGQN
jgi:hypothetical protein